MFVLNNTPSVHARVYLQYLKSALPGTWIRVCVGIRYVYLYYNLNIQSVLTAAKNFGILSRTWRKSPHHYNSFRPWHYKAKGSNSELALLLSPLMLPEFNSICSWIVFLLTDYRYPLTPLTFYVWIQLHSSRDFHLVRIGRRSSIAAAAAAFICIDAVHCT
jgi:hypothetical protein